MQKAFIIIPTYNERENIQKVIPILLKVFSKIKQWDMQILVVDDSSPDKTADVVRELEKKDKRIHLFLNKQKAGLGGAYLKGMDHAFNTLNADVVFEFDADLSHDPEKIPLFLEKIDQGYDLVLGSRYIAGGGIPDDWGLHRKFLSVVGNLTIQVVLFDFRIRDWTGGYRAITREVYEAVQAELQSERFSGYTFQIGFLTKAVRKGFKVTEIPFKFVDRTIGESKLGMEYIKNTLLYIFRLRGREITQHRLFKFVMTGGVGALVQLVSLQVFRSLLPQFSWLFFSTLNVANFLANEVAIVSNFTLGNLWTFSDRKLVAHQIPRKFIKFNLTSAGSILLQFVIVRKFEALFGIFPIVTLPMINYRFDSGTAYVVLGILLGMFWNFFAYSTFIWKKTSTRA